MDVKEKLVELLNNSFAEQYEKRGLLTAPHTATDLIAHGVTVQDSKVVEIDQFNEWISVKDRFPEREQIVLVCGSRKGIYTAEFRMDGKYPYFHKLNSKTHWCEPTHWMPLPPAPKGE